MYTDSGLIVIHDGNVNQFVDPVVDGETKRCGTIPRPKTATYRAARAVDFPLYDQSQWGALLRQQAADGRRCSDFRNHGDDGRPIPSRDQNGRGYCWQHSGVSAMLIVRARDGQPYVDLSPYAPACREKQYRDEGGWGAQGVNNLFEWGCPDSAHWPQRAVDRRYDTPETWANAARYKVDEGWWDLQAAEYDRNLSWQQYATCWLLGIPTVCDYNWWSHSVCGMDLVEGAALFATLRAASGKRPSLQEFHAAWDMSDPVTAGFGGLIWNSWGDSWSNNGAGILVPSKVVPDGGCAVRTVTASAA